MKTLKAEMLADPATRAEYEALGVRAAVRIESVHP
jgi:hypothetical protein